MVDIKSDYTILGGRQIERLPTVYKTKPSILWRSGCICESW